MNVAEFQRVITSTLNFASETDAIITLGMKPTRPETGYGYIQADLAQQSLRNKEIFRVDSFREKPNLETAKEYISHNYYFWNAGIFIWNVRTIVNAFRMYQPLIAATFEDIIPVMGTPEEQKVVDEKYPECENISVDYAILEKAEEIFVFPADFGWSDLGTWGSLQTLSKKDEDGNAIISPNVKLFESSNCIVNVEGAKQVAIQGLDGYIVAERDGRLLICKLADEQRIKEFSK
jgi:mannose-1-phosphate guanylyltransferase